MSRVRLSCAGVAGGILALLVASAVGLPQTAVVVPDLAAAAKPAKECKKTCKSLRRSCMKRAAGELKAARKGCGGTGADKRLCKRVAVRTARQARAACASGLAACKTCCARTGTVCPDLAGPGIAGRVVDTAGNPVAGATVTGPAATAATDSDGRFRLHADAGDGKIVVFSRQGWVTSARIVSVPPETVAWLPVVMMALAPPIALDATAGGTVSGARGASLTAPPGAFVDAQGTPVSGAVEVSLTPYDPAIAQEALAYPGELRGLTLAGATIPLETFGVMDVTVRQGGRVLPRWSARTSPPSRLILATPRASTRRRSRGPLAVTA